ncbi:MAG: cupin domain-containing protein [Pseudomonadota bacterium]|nr:cupin domain-containing protein [Pseudomonadota bacterium]
MDVSLPSALLGGLSPALFMRRHWQKKPLLVRQACPDVQPPLSRTELFALASQADVESRLVRGPSQRIGSTDAWQVRPGPLTRRMLPPISHSGWTLLVQGLELHVPAARALLDQFRFVPDARLDDLMVSWASPGGGVGAHLDSYDVFLLQVQGQRRWRVGKVARPAWVDGAPLKLLRDFTPTQDWLLQPGDMLYLPPGYGHEGTAEGGDCMTCSIGFRAPSGVELARELLLQLADACSDDGSASARGGAGLAVYRDPQQPATATPAALPEALESFARAGLARVLSDPDALGRALGELLSEPKPRVWFESRGPARTDQGLALDAGTRMLYDAGHVYINGESFRSGGRDAALMQGLADSRTLTGADHRRLSTPARALVQDWVEAGWLHAFNA